MKSILITVIALLSVSLLSAQDFPVVWKSKFGFNPDKWNRSTDGKYVLGRDESQAEMLDGVTGKSLWKINFSKDLKIKSMARAVLNYGEGVILFFNKDGKKENGDKVVVDYFTGKELWRTKGFPGIDADDNFHLAHCVDLAYKGAIIVFDDTDKKFKGIDLRTGAQKWASNASEGVDLKKNVIINEIEGSEYAQVLISYEEDATKNKVEYLNILTGASTGAENFVSKGGNYTRESQNRIVIAKTVNKTSIKLIGSMRMFSTGKISFELKVSGDYNWSKAFESKAVRQLFGGIPYVRLDVQDDKLFVLSQKITAFDLKTGTQLWEAPFDNSDNGMSGLRTKQELGIAGWPLASGNFVYYVDLQVDNVIKKVDAATGKVVWKSDKFKSSDRIPNLIIVNGVLIAQFGGMINRQLYWSNNNGQYWKSENHFDGDFGVRAYDLNTGASLWDTHQLRDKLDDKFSDRITTIYGAGNKLVVASDKNVFCLDAKNGSVVYKTPISPSKIGDVFELLVSEDNLSLYVLCDQGVASLEIASGKLKYATKTGEVFWKEIPGTDTYSFSHGANYFLRIGEKEFIGFDLATGSIKGKMKNKVHPSFTEDGNFIFDRDDEAMTKYAVNKP